MDESVWADTPYNEADLQEQYDRAPTSSTGSEGVQIQNDVNNYVAGDQPVHRRGLRRTRRKLPGEYDLIDPSQSICLPGHQWKVNDVIAIASLVAGIFGKGGGGELGARSVARGGPAAVRRQRRARRSGPTSSRSTTPRRPPRSTARASLRPAARRIRAGVALPDPGTRPARRHVGSSPATRQRARLTTSLRPGGKLPRAPERRSSSATAPPTRCSSRRASRRAATRWR